VVTPVLHFKCMIRFHPKISSCLARILVASVVKATTVTELIGMSIADVSGESNPATANESPILLYRNDTAKLIYRMDTLDFAKRRNRSK